jgi:hypothetical protein
MIEGYHEPILQSEMTYYLTCGDGLDYSEGGHHREIVHHITGGLDRLNAMTMGYAGNSSGLVENDNDGL